MTGDRIVLAHGGGGILGRELLDEVILPGLPNDVLAGLADAAVLEADLAGGRIAFTTDTFVVRPLFFRGGDIGRLAVAGTVNDLAVSGAEPRWLSLGLVIEEGFLIDDLRRIVASIARTAREAEVSVVCGDTKVVGRGEADGIFINTSGVGVVPPGVSLSPSGARPGDAVVVSGFLGEHGIAVMSEREGISFETSVSSDVAPLGHLVGAVMASGAAVRVMRDPTRGGVAAALNEIADASGVTITLDEEALPVSDAVAGACDMLGLDVLAAANEGKVLIICAPGDAGRVVSACRSYRLGAHAELIGEVAARRGVGLILRTGLGGERVVDMPYGEALPRIC